MKEDVYLIVFKDGSIMLFGVDPKKESFQDMTRCFRVPDNMTIEAIRTFVYVHQCETEFYSLIKQIW